MDSFDLQGAAGVMPPAEFGEGGQKRLEPEQNHRNSVSGLSEEINRNK